ncbi:nuclease-related domain-containing DEAD/DEAH box helicase [Sinorhizobium fredii]|uniref:nuclease-related domain-containing DEAD/DEAH box helicase n=1 Tax=Rhizobium fredii TaxID=380 RepID=UPI000565928D|nr:NERD domain-containing protein [Sinorhizobium fredii]
MARMHPRELPKHVLNDPKRSSEVRVYQRIRDQVPDDYVCYYSRSWHEADDDGAEFDGEADFILAHPKQGLLFIEVKGGRVSCREEDEQWLSTDRDGFRFRIKNPIAQAKSSKHHFLKRLNENRRLRGRFLRARHAAILPGSARPARALGPDAPQEIIAFGDDMDTLGNWLVQRMNEGGDPREQPLGLDGMRALEDLLAGHFELRAHIGTSLAEDAEVIERLTAEQAWILDSLEDNREMAISGGAGSGKTVLAIEKAFRSAANGRRTLLTCYNAPLANYLKDLCKDRENLVVAGFHSLCRAFAERTGTQLPASAGQELFNTHMPEGLIEAITKEPTLGFDTIIVDEGQDFRDHWLNALRLCLNHAQDSEFYVFFDDNQRLFAYDDNFISALPQAAISLTRNLRNTRKIHSLMVKWYQGKQSRAVGPEGEPVGVIECKRTDMAMGRVNERITQLVRSGQMTPDQIAILAGSAAEVDLAPARIAGIETCPADNIRPDRIVLDTIRRFKGLSRPCVFIVGIEHITEPELIYVATSRANLLLELAGTKEEIARIGAPIQAEVQ